MIPPDKIEKLGAFMSAHPTAVIATADANGRPAAAVILFAHDDQFRIIFGTHPSRKFTNLQANPRAALVLSKDWSAIQLHGPVIPLTGADSEAAMKLFMAKHPEMDQHMVAGSTFFCLTPEWMRFMDTSKRPPEQWEVTC